MKEFEEKVNDIFDKKTGEKIGEAISYPASNNGFEQFTAGVPMRGIFMDAAGDNPFESEINAGILEPEKETDLT